MKENWENYPLIWVHRGNKPKQRYNYVCFPKSCQHYHNDFYYYVNRKGYTFWTVTMKKYMMMKMSQP